MDKERFKFLLRNNSSLTEEETQEVNSELIKFPYSQVLHNLAARGSQLNKLANSQSQLGLAAVYSTDRSVLKSFITAPPKIREKIDVIKRAEPSSAPIQEPDRTDPDSESTDLNQEIGLEGDDLLDEVYHDLDLLKESKHNFELVADGFEIPERQNIPEARKLKVDKQKKEKPDKPVGLIAEIKNTKKKIKPSDPKQKEQLEIIDQFIKSKPSIPKNKTNQDTPEDDLSESSSVYSDNIISETLVEILIKQGKKEKAVEVLKKLIWKFPQKKAYFAAQIEELTR